ncbi:AMP-binding protein [Streptomyces sp. TRM66268-LWL]|uniref:Acyl-CoA synthetase n=1 Tax=Streptomyces polyasparticus TaxID=2767826 RepID=A0ABR7SDQ2_9ACTN|nr:AMP-dependent synthetase/ligase [Streptomyces polyasparticus]MBC9713631.1 AMP-binding protein [Streptomyces polyasparticus]
MSKILRLPGAPEELTLPALLLRNAEDHGDRPALSWRAGDGWSTLTWTEVRRHVTELAAGYAQFGVGRGDHVLMMMGNRPEHWLSDLALTHLGAVPVSVYNTAAPGQIAHIARHSRARLAVIEGEREIGRWAPLLDGTALERLVVVEPEAAADHTPYGEVLAAGHDGDAFEKAWREIRPADPLTVVYTSGTTGDPKGVRITHRNVIRNALALDAVVELPDHAEHISYLPFAHIAERMLGIYLPVFRAAHVHLCPDPAHLAPTVRELRPVQFFGVPRVWEKLAAAVRAMLAQAPPERRRAIEKACDTARAHLAHREKGEPVPGPLDAAYRHVKKHVLDPILALAGFDRLLWTASASAPMPPDVMRFWAGFGLTIMDAWGLTETVGVATTNSPGAFRLGSVGRPVQGVEVRIAEDGEILVRGGTVFDGYLQADGSVADACDAEGWFATGDIGRLDEDGYLWLTDRKKEMIITSTGKNVSPALVENTLKGHPLIGQALAYGDGRSYLVALLVLDPDTFPLWAEEHGVPADPREPAVREEIEQAVAAANERLSSTEQIKRFEILGEEWGPETGELTPSLKLRRRVITERYRADIEQLYSP